MQHVNLFCVVTGKYDKAKDAYKKLLELNPGNTIAKSNPE